MKANLSGHCDLLKAGWSVWELVLVVFVVAALALMLIPAWMKAKARSSRVSCVNNMKQIGTGFRLFAGDNDMKYPFASIGPTNTGGAADLWMLFQLAANDLSSPRILVCPDDKERRRAEDFFITTNSPIPRVSFAHPSQRNSALSFFYALDADEDTPSKLLVGDRNLTRDPKASDNSPGKVFLTGAQNLGSTTDETKDFRWSTKIHDRNGNVAFPDGSVQQLTSPQLREAARKSGDTTNRVWMPN